MPALLPGQPVGVLRTVQQAVPEQTKISCVADAGAYEVTLVTFPAVAALTQADYFYYENQAGDDFAVWFDIDAAGTPPSGAVYTAATTKIEVNVTTGQTAAQVAAAAVAAIGVQFSDVTVVDNEDGTVLFTQDLIGTCVDAAPYSEDDGGAGSIAVSVQTQGAASTLQNKYFEMQEGDGSTVRYVWANVGTEGVDPTGNGTALEYALSAGASASAVATALASALDGDGDLVAFASGSDVYVRNAASGNAADVVDVDSGFTFLVTHQGYDAEENLPGGSPSDFLVQPNLKSAPV